MHGVLQANLSRASFMLSILYQMKFSYHSKFHRDVTYAVDWVLRSSYFLISIFVLVVFLQRFLFFNATSEKHLVCS